ncbi:MAG: vitamin K epoxide reductase family protein [Thermoplasmata archaeon]
MYTRIYREELILRLILILSLIGFGLSGYLTYVHFNANEGWCPTGGECYEVWTSPYSTILSVPVALIGLIGYLVIFSLSFLRLYYLDLGFVEKFPTYILIFSVVGTAFSIYLTAIEIFVIQAICDFCFSAFLTMIAILGLITYGILKGKSEEMPAEPQAA